MGATKAATSARRQLDTALAVVMPHVETMALKMRRRVKIGGDNNDNDNDNDNDNNNADGGGRERISSRSGGGAGSGRWEREYCSLDAVKNGGKCQALAGTGERIYGSFKTGTRLLRVKLYEFGIYVGETEMIEHVSESIASASALERMTSGTEVAAATRARRGPLHFIRGIAVRPYALLFRRRGRRDRRANTSGAERGGGRGYKPSPAAAATTTTSEAGQCGVDARKYGVEEVLRHVNHDHVPLSVVYRFSRDLPVDRVREEYDAVLRRRMGKLGGDPEDPDIDKLLAALSIRPESWINEKDHYYKGTEMVFSRRPGGILTGDINGRRIVAINNEKLCSAFFDVYTSRVQPLSPKARRQVGEFMRSVTLAAAEADADANADANDMGTSA